MKKLTLVILFLSAISLLEACNNGANGDAARNGKSDTVGAAQNSNGLGAAKDSTNGLKDTLKHK